MTTPSLHYQRAQPSPLWSRLCLETRIGRGLARIPRVLCGKAPCGAAPARSRLARPVVAPPGRGRKWRERPRFLAADAPRGRGRLFMRAFIHSFPLPLGVTPSTVIPGGKAIEPMRKPGPAHRPQAVQTARETPTQAATIRTRRGSKQAPSRNIAQATFSSPSATERIARVWV